MKIIFAGTPEFALPALDSLLKAKHNVCAVYTQPDRPAGRGQKITSPPIKIFALQNNLPIYQPENFKDPDLKTALANFQADVFIDVACGLFLPKSILNITRFGAINIHPSLLPRFRGAAPIQRAILAGDRKTGVTIMQMDEGLDTGPILKQKSIAIESHDTTQTLSVKLANLGASLLLEVLAELQNGTTKSISQDNSLSSYAEKITKEEAKLDWEHDANILERKIRAFNPWPVAFTTLGDITVRIWDAYPVISPEENVKIVHEPGSIIAITKNGIDVATKNGILRIIKAQFPGGKVLEVKDLLNAKKNVLFVGARFN